MKRIFQEFCWIFDISTMIQAAEQVASNQLISALLDAFITDVILNKADVPNDYAQVPQQYLVVEPAIYKVKKSKIKKRRKSFEPKEQKSLNIKKKEMKHLIYNGVTTLAPPTPSGLDSGFTSIQNSRRSNIPNENTLMSTRDNGLDLSFFERFFFGKRLANKDQVIFNIYAKELLGMI